MKSRQTIVFQSIEDQTTEHVMLTHARGYSAAGTIVGLAEGAAVNVSYRIDLDVQWNVRCVHVRRAGRPAFHFLRDLNGWRDAHGETMPRFSTCREVDLNLTPFTNTIPIRRLHPAPGTAVDITVMYFDLLDWSVMPASQRYTYNGQNKYQFESLETGFAATITVDDEGIVTDYPGLWRRLYAVKV